METSSTDGLAGLEVLADFNRFGVMVAPVKEGDGLRQDKSRRHQLEAVRAPIGLCSGMMLVIFGFKGDQKPRIQKQRLHGLS